MYICLNRGTTGVGLTLEDFVKLAADAGFHGADVDLSFALQHGTTALHDLYATHAIRFGGWGPPDWRGDQAKWRDGLAELKKTAHVAGTLRIDSCATWIMPSSDRPFLENWRFHVERLRDLAKVLDTEGLRLGLEFVAPYHLRRKFPHEFIFTPGLMLELAAEVGDNVGLLVDCFHCHTAGETWERISQLPAPKIVLAHLNDAPNLPVTAVQDGERLLPGDGVINLAAYLESLKQAGYDGPVSLEVFNQTLRDLPPAAAAKRAWDSCRSLVR